MPKIQSQIWNDETCFHSLVLYVTQPTQYRYREGCVIICGYLWVTQYVMCTDSKLLHKMGHYSLDTQCYIYGSLLLGRIV